MANVNVGANLGFKVGEQSAVNTILANGTGAVHGSFYLTIFYVLPLVKDGSKLTLIHILKQLLLQCH